TQTTQGPGGIEEYQSTDEDWLPIEIYSADDPDGFRRRWFGAEASWALSTDSATWSSTDPTDEPSPPSQPAPIITSIVAMDGGFLLTAGNGRKEWWDGDKGVRDVGSDGTPIGPIIAVEGFEEAARRTKPVRTSHQVRSDGATDEYRTDSVYNFWIVWDHWKNARGDEGGFEGDIHTGYQRWWGRSAEGYSEVTVSDRNTHSYRYYPDGSLAMESSGATWGVPAYYILNDPAGNHLRSDIDRY